MSRWVYQNREPQGEEHECNDCGIMIPTWRPICTLCERWCEERGLKLPDPRPPKNGTASESTSQPEANE